MISTSRSFPFTRTAKLFTPSRAGGAQTAPVLTLKWALCHGQITFSPTSVPSAKRPATMGAASNATLLEQSHRIRPPPHQTALAEHAWTADPSDGLRDDCRERGGADDSQRAGARDYQQEPTWAGLDI